MLSKALIIYLLFTLTILSQISCLESGPLLEVAPLLLEPSPDATKAPEISMNNNNDDPNKNIFTMITDTLTVPSDVNDCSGFEDGPSTPPLVIANDSNGDPVIPLELIPEASERPLLPLSEEIGNTSVLEEKPARLRRQL